MFRLKITSSSGKSGSNEGIKEGGNNSKTAASTSLVIVLHIVRLLIIVVLIVRKNQMLCISTIVQKLSIFVLLVIFIRLDQGSATYGLRSHRSIRLVHFNETPNVTFGNH